MNAHTREMNVRADEMNVRADEMNTKPTVPLLALSRRAGVR